MFRLVKRPSGGSGVSATSPSAEVPARGKRADALRNQQTLLAAAAEVFVTSGVDAPVREIAARAGVGVGTIYRHFPTRADLIVAVYRHQLEACAEAGLTPFAALHAYFIERLVPVCAQLLDAAAAAREVRPDIDALTLMRGVGNLCIGADHDPHYDARRLVDLL